MSDCVLTDLINLSRDGEWGKSEPFEGCVKMAAIRGTDFDAVRQGDVASVPIRFIKEHIAKYKILHGGEILIEAAGGSKGQITGRTIYLKSKTVARFDMPVTCASFSRFIRLKQSESWDTRYVFWLLQYLYHFGFMDKYHTQHTGVSRFQWTVFAENEPLALPPLPTQRKIAAILSAYDDLIENNLRRIKILEEMAQNLYREWFVKFHFPGHEKARFVDSPLGQIPEGWEVVNLLDFAVIKYGRNLPTKNLSPDGAYPVYGAAKIIGRYTEYTREERTIIAGCRGSVGEMQITLPKCFVTNNSFTFDVQQQIDFFWLFHFLKERGFADVIGGAAQPQITLDGLSKVQILVPPKTTRVLFHEHIEDMFSLLWNLEDRNANLRRTRDLLLPKLISGEVDVSELDITVPEEAA